MVTLLVLPPSLALLAVFLALLILLSLSSSSALLSLSLAPIALLALVLSPPLLLIVVSPVLLSLVTLLGPLVVALSSPSTLSLVGLSRTASLPSLALPTEATLPAALVDVLFTTLVARGRLLAVVRDVLSSVATVVAPSLLAEQGVLGVLALVADVSQCLLSLSPGLEPMTALVALSTARLQASPALLALMLAALALMLAGLAGSHFLPSTLTAALDGVVGIVFAPSVASSVLRSPPVVLLVLSSHGLRAEPPRIGSGHSHASGSWWSVRP